MVHHASDRCYNPAKSLNQRFSNGGAVDLMNAEDRARLKAANFDREAWATLWDRLPERARRSTLEFVLHKLHAIESSGRFSMSWHYETNEEREESGSPIFDDDQPGDIITFKGSLQIGRS
jgi:hypothetical protein